MTADRRTTNGHKLNQRELKEVTSWAKVNYFFSWRGWVCNRVYDLWSLKISALSIKSAMTTCDSTVFWEGTRQNPFYWWLYENANNALKGQNLFQGVYEYSMKQRRYRMTGLIRHMENMQYSAPPSRKPVYSWVRWTEQLKT